MHKYKTKMAKAGHKYNMSKKHHEDEAEGMKKASPSKKPKAHKKSASHMAMAGHKYNISKKHHERESEGMKHHLDMFAKRRSA